MSERAQSEPESSIQRVPLSRRRLLAAVALGAGSLGLSRMGSVTAATRANRLNQAGQALEPAERIPPSTVEPVTFEPPAEGEILFPIVVGEDDHCGVLDNFGECRDGCSRSHVGVDIMADGGLPIRAVVDGVLTRRSSTSFYGWTLHDDVNDVIYRYFHITSDPNGLEVGDRVQQGDIIGFVGDTGTTPGNYHLHFEYRPGNVPADCYDLLERAEHVLFW